MTARHNPGCAFGPCNDSKQVGGGGCHLCDDIATLPQRGSAVMPDASDVAIDEPATLVPSVGPVAKKKVAVQAPSKRRRGPQSGSLFT